MSTAVWTSYGPVETRQMTVAPARLIARVPQPSVTPTPHLNIDLQQAITPTLSCSESPNVVQIAIQTTVTIPNYSELYSTPIGSFQPTYQSLEDGSLVTPVLIEDARQTNAWLAVIGALLMFFVFNSLLSINFIQRVKIKKKTLFYILLASQVLGIVGSVPELLSHIYNISDCTT